MFLAAPDIKKDPEEYDKNFISVRLLILMHDKSESAINFSFLDQRNISLVFTAKITFFLP